jgi:hypothetical protein
VIHKRRSEQSLIVGGKGRGGQTFFALSSRFRQVGTVCLVETGLRHGPVVVFELTVFSERTARSVAGPIGQFGSPNEGAHNTEPTARRDHAVANGSELNEHRFAGRSIVAQRWLVVVIDFGREHQTVNPAVVKASR